MIYKYKLIYIEQKLNCGIAGNANTFVSFGTIEKCISFFSLKKIESLVLMS